MFENYVDNKETKRKMLIVKYMIKHIFEAESWHNFKDTIKIIYT